MSQKTAIITGGSRGLGKDMVINLAQNGVNIIFSYHTNTAKANEVIQELEALGQKAIAFPFDANKPESSVDFIKSATDYLTKENGNPNFDFLVNNAGTGTFNLVANTSETQFDEMMNIIFVGVFDLKIINTKIE